MPAPHVDAGAPAPVGPRLAASEIVAFALPSFGLGISFLLNALLLMKFATEVLHVAPVAIGAILLGARVWDAVSDPIVGNLSDRTRSRFGRRRPWLVASVLPIAVGIAMIWSPPAALEGSALTAWMAAAILVFYTAITIFSVPYYSLGAELSPDYHERSRVFAFQQGFMIAATLLAGVLASGVLEWADDPRAAARAMAVGVALLMAGTIAVCVGRVRERAALAPRAERRLVRAMRDVFANPHARLLYLTYVIETAGTAAIGSVAAYYTDHVLQAASYLPFFLAFYVVPGLALIPLVLRVSRRVGKVRAWQASLCLQAVAFLALATLSAGDFWIACAFVAFLSVGATAGQVLAPSVQSDVVDWDELATGERKEGAYFATRNFFLKVAYGFGPLTLGVVFHATGSDGAEVVTEGAILGMRVLIGVMPAIGALLGALVLTRFRLTEAEHARIRAAIEERDRERLAAAAS
ncbi:MAG: MFS transporter [Myxococcota bacterium]